MNCLFFAIYAKLRLGKGKIIVLDWNGLVPHFALLVNGERVFHYISGTDRWYWPFYMMVGLGEVETEVYKPKSLE